MEFTLARSGWFLAEGARRIRELNPTYGKNSCVMVWRYRRRDGQVVPHIKGAATLETARSTVTWYVSRLSDVSLEIPGRNGGISRA